MGSAKPRPTAPLYWVRYCTLGFIAHVADIVHFSTNIKYLKMP